IYSSLHSISLITFVSKLVKNGVKLRFHLKKQSFIQGAIVLMIAGLITRFLGFFNRIILARLLGNEGIGIYMLVLPTFFLIITLSQFGLPVVITKLTAEASKAAKHHKIRKILIITLCQY